jgi:hypothetical protein
MLKWKLFGKSKESEKSKPQTEDKETNQILDKSTEGIENVEEIEQKPLAEYHETLQTGKPRSKKYENIRDPYESDQRIWRDISLIEDKVDDLHKTRAEKPVTEIDKKVDSIIIDVEIDKKKEDSRKPPNVIYVVSKPQPGQVKGDWAVRSHGKIYSHHRKKQNAIKEARKIAKEKGATVLVQNTDGTFSDGFKPR